MNPTSSRALALALAALGLLSAPANADLDDVSRLSSLSSSVPDVGGFTTLTVHSPLVGSPVRIAFDTQLGPRFAGNFNRPVFQLSTGLVSVGGGSIGADGTYSVMVPTPAPGQTVYYQAVVYSNGFIRESNMIRLDVGSTQSATFTDGSAGIPQAAPFGTSTSDVDWYDLDKDGCQDIVRANAGAAPSILINDCSGNFTDESALRLPAGLPAAACVEVGDFNGDSWPDLFFCGGPDASSPAPNFALLNDRAGNFVALDSPTAIAILGAPGSLPGGGGQAIEASFGDSDGDGDLDLMVVHVADADHPGETIDPISIYENTGLDTGAFIVGETFEDLAGSATHGNQASAMFADVDGDADLDVFLVGTFVGAGAQNQLYVNAGGGNYFNATATALPTLLDNSQEVQAADFDGDGDVDFFVANTISSATVAVHFYENVTTTPDVPVFIDGSARIPADLGPVTKVRLGADVGDIDNDGDIDIVVAIHELPGAGGVTDGETVILVNQGGAQAGIQGEFLVDTSFLPGLFITADVALGDADFDGDLDLYVANSGNLFQFDFRDELWINDL